MRTGLEGEPITAFGASAAITVSDGQFIREPSARRAETRFEASTAVTAGLGAVTRGLGGPTVIA